MPNWCCNALDVQGDKADIDKFVKDNRTEVTELDFSYSVPLLSNEDPKDVWGCRNAEDVFVTSYEGSDSALYLFDTPWSPPIEWLTKTSLLYPTLTFYLRYEEGGDDLQGELLIKNGSSIKP